MSKGFYCGVSVCVQIWCGLAGHSPRPIAPSARLPPLPSGATTPLHHKRVSLLTPVGGGDDGDGSLLYAQEGLL